MAAPTSVTDVPAGRLTLPPVAWGPIATAIVASGGLLAATAGSYGYHRDELYFRMLPPAWGYTDQPPLTPLIAHLATAVFGDTVWAARVPAVVCIGAAIVLAALTTRELGGGRLAQALSAWGFAFCSLPLVSGHVFVTATVDFALWAAVLLCVARALLRDEPRWWLVAGVIVGLSMYNKLLIAMLVISLAVGLLVVGPRRVLASRWVWGAIGLALLIGSPNVIYQATHGFPQLSMGGALSENNADDVRAQVIPFQILLVGPPLLPVWIAGIVALLRRPAWRSLRAVAVAYLVAVVLTFIGGGQIYYAFGLQAFLLAAGWLPTVDWLRRAPWRRWLVGAALVLNAVVNAFLALPLIPIGAAGGFPAVAINPTIGDQVGWPEYVRQVADVYATLTPEQQARAVMFTGNYGEAGALDRYGAPYGLPPAYSGQNELFTLGPPPADRTVVVVWTQGQGWLARAFARCEVRATLDNGFGVDNEEQGSFVAVCEDPVGGWATLWPQLHHLD